MPGAGLGGSAGLAGVPNEYASTVLTMTMAMIVTINDRIRLAVEDMAIPSKGNGELIPKQELLLK